MYHLLSPKGDLSFAPCHGSICNQILLCQEERGRGSNDHFRSLLALTLHPYDLFWKDLEEEYPHLDLSKMGLTIGIKFLLSSLYVFIVLRWSTSKDVTAVEPETNPDSQIWILLDVLRGRLKRTNSFSM
jgi:hypothetical protein